MKINRQQEKLASIAATWYSTYKLHRNWGTVRQQHFLDIYSKLLALSGKGTKKEIDQIIGNSSWTDLNCDECDKVVDKLVTVGNVDYVAAICIDCLRKAAQLIEND